LAAGALHSIVGAAATPRLSLQLPFSALRARPFSRVVPRAGRSAALARARGDCFQSLPASWPAALPALAPRAISAFACAAAGWWRGGAALEGWLALGWDGGRVVEVRQLAYSRSLAPFGRIGPSPRASLNSGYALGQEDETYSISLAHGYFGRLIFQAASFNNSRSLHFFLGAWPVAAIWLTSLGASTMAFTEGELEGGLSLFQPGGPAPGAPRGSGPHLQASPGGAASPGLGRPFSMLGGKTLN